MSNGRRMQRYSRIAGIGMLVFFAMVLYMMHQQAKSLKERKEGPRANEAPRLITDPKAVEELAARDAFLDDILKGPYAILLEKDITGDHKAETLAVVYARPGRTDLMKRLVIISPRLEGYDVLLDVKGGWVSGRGMKGASGGPADQAERATLFRPRAVTLQKVEVEPCRDDGEPLGYRLDMKWDWSVQRFKLTRTNVAVAAESGP